MFNRSPSIIVLILIQNILIFKLNFVMSEKIVIVYILQFHSNTSLTPE